MRVVGTAGHVDHGKSSLVQAITGINPDRLAEEQRRQMTIDLGFAWLTLPDGESVGIVDVPGHRDFIENMLAGVGGIDAVLFVVAADEGIMPQTKEHLAILDLLNVQRGIISLTKIDSVDDEWLDLVEEDVLKLVSLSSLGKSPIVRVSAKTGEGLDELVVALQKTLQETPRRPDLGAPRLPIDRLFTIDGFGTVVTGTLHDGAFAVGDSVEIHPGGAKGRIRGLQTHKEKMDRVIQGSRVAVNINGVEVDEVERGEVVIKPGTYKSTSMIDVHFRSLSDSEHVLRHNQEVKLYIGAAQRIAKIRLLGREMLIPGEEGWLQLLLSDRVVAARGDRFILRRPSPSSTLGGGVVADAHPKRRHRLKDQDVIGQLEAIIKGSPATILQRTLARVGPISIAESLKEAGLSEDEAKEAIRELTNNGELVVFEGNDLSVKSSSLIVDKHTWLTMAERIKQILGFYHQANPLRSGMPIEELRSKMEIDSKLATLLLEQAAKEEYVVIVQGYVILKDHRVQLDANMKQRVDQLLIKFHSAPYAPPSIKEATKEIGEDLVRFLLESGSLVQVSVDVVFKSEVYEEMVAQVKSSLEKNRTITVAQVRDIFQTSRKYALALMEHLDAIGLTVREGDERRLV
ncbi:MAG: selenocysteine-specific translation elongation factor [Anaerolineales bacterium]|nr:selenocysteine-specific translation elongation factor [Anaerolineales bacterium]